MPKCNRDPLPACGQCNTFSGLVLCEKCAEIKYRAKATDGLSKLINWLELLRADASPPIPYNLHPLLDALHTTLGWSEAERLLMELRDDKS